MKPVRLRISPRGAGPRIGTSGECSTHMYHMAVTFEVSHSEMSALKLVAF